MPRAFVTCRVLSALHVMPCILTVMIHVHHLSAVMLREWACLALVHQISKQYQSKLTFCYGENSGQGEYSECT